MMHGRAGGLLNQETLKPRALGDTLVRLGGYFGQYWYMIVLAVLFVVISTWTQVVTPELMGQATDCFLVPTGASAVGIEDDSLCTSTCYLTTDNPAELTLSRRLIHNLYSLGGFEAVDIASATDMQRIEGLFRLILVMIGLFVLGAVLTGATFFTMAWTGQHVLRVLRIKVFEQ